MINEKKKRNQQRMRRQFRIRKKVRGNAEKPRLCIFKSNQHIYAQLIDDEKGVTIASAGTITKEFREKKLGRKSKDSARHLGVCIAELAKKQNVARAVFDRGIHKYHGLLADVADAARETGLQF